MTCLAPDSRPACPCAWALLARLAWTCPLQAFWVGSAHSPLHARLRQPPHAGRGRPFSRGSALARAGDGAGRSGPGPEDPALGQPWGSRGAASELAQHACTPYCRIAKAPEPQSTAGSATRRNWCCCPWHRRRDLPAVQKATGAPAFCAVCPRKKKVGGLVHAAPGPKSESGCVLLHSDSAQFVNRPGTWPVQCPCSTRTN